MKALQERTGTFPKPQSIQSDSGTHFTAKTVQERAAREGVSGVFHAPYYPQANGIVERTNGLLKRFLKAHKPGGAERVGDAVTSVSSRRGTNGCPKMRAFCPQAPTIVPTSPGPDRSDNPSRFPGQPVLVELPTVGAVPLTLDAPVNKYTWRARDACRKIHNVHAMMDCSFLPPREASLLLLLFFRREQPSRTHTTRRKLDKRRLPLDQDAHVICGYTSLGMHL